MSETNEKIEGGNVEGDKLVTEKIAPKKREIIILTDGDNIELTKAEVSGKIELIAILQSVIAALNQKK